MTVQYLIKKKKSTKHKACSSFSSPSQYTLRSRTHLKKEIGGKGGNTKGSLGRWLTKFLEFHQSDWHVLYGQSWVIKLLSCNYFLLLTCLNCFYFCLQKVKLEDKDLCIYQRFYYLYKQNVCHFSRCYSNH